MSGDADIITQDEIEELLKQAQAAARGVSAPPPASASKPPAEPAVTPAANQMESNNPEITQKGASVAKPATAPITMGQDEIAAMLGSVKGSPVASTASAASATATKPPPASPTAPPKRNVTDDISYLLSQAEEALASVDQPSATNLAGLAPFELHDFGGSPATSEKATLELLRDVELDVKIELGRTHMHLDEVLRLRRGSVVSLDKLAGDPVDVYVNGRLVARGEVLVLNDNFCVRVAELLASEENKAA